MAAAREFPKYDKPLLAGFGASLVAIGLGIGSGEFVLWPYLSVHYGYGILWAAIVGIAFQVFINIEIQRYAVVTGNSAVHGFLKVSRFFSFWLIFSTIVGFGWPGLAAGSSFLFSQAFGLPGNVAEYLPYGILLLAVGLLVIGSNSYPRVEKFFRFVLPLTFLLMVGLTVYYFDPVKMTELLAGLIGKGSGYQFIPEGIDLAVFLAAFAYAGSGGNLLLGQGYYILKKKHGMSQYGEKSGLVASESPRSLHHFKGVRRLITIENILVFGLMGLITIVMLSYLGPIILQGVSVEHGLAFIVAQGTVLSGKLHPFVGLLFVLSGAVALFSVQLGVFDTLGRITADILGKPELLWYKLVIIVQGCIGVCIFLLGLREPLWLITIGAVSNALAMAVIAAITLWMNRTHLPVKYRPSLLEQLLLGCIALVYAGFFMVTVWSYLVK